MRREEAVEPFDADVEALDEQVELVLLGRGARLVDLDPGRAELDQRLEVRPDQVPRDVERQLAPRLDLLLAPVAGSEPARLRDVVLVVRPDGERVGAGDRDLQPRLRDRLEERELGVVVRLGAARPGRPRPTSSSTCCRSSGRFRAARTRSRARSPRRTSRCASARRPRSRRRRRTPACGRSSGSTSAPTSSGSAPPRCSDSTSSSWPSTPTFSPQVRACSMSLSSSSRPWDVLTSQGGLPSEPISWVRNSSRRSCGRLRLAEARELLAGDRLRDVLEVAVRDERDPLDPALRELPANAAISAGSSRTELRTSTTPASSSLSRPSGTASRCVA